VLNDVGSSRAKGSAERFLGVRLTAEELEKLDRFRLDQGSPNRSEAVRTLVRSADRTRASFGELPTSIRNELEEIVEDGWVRDANEAVTLVLTLGLQELSRLHGDRLPRLRRTARDVAEGRERRRRIDREGRGLLER